MAECLLENECKDLPLIVIRPSIVSASWQDPLPGWTGSNGVAGYITAIGLGLLRTLYLRTDKTEEVVPVDLVVNCILASIWYHARTMSRNALICNCTLSDVNPHNFAECKRPFLETLKLYPFSSRIRNAKYKNTKSATLHKIRRMVYHYIPAIVVDGFCMRVKREPKMRKAYKKMEALQQAYEFFTTKEWKWDNTVYNTILESIPSNERDTFDFDMGKVVWDTYYRAYVLGVKMYVLKDDMVLSNLQAK